MKRHAHMCSVYGAAVACVCACASFYAHCSTQCGLPPPAVSPTYCAFGTWCFNFHFKYSINQYKTIQFKHKQIVFFTSFYLCFEEDQSLPVKTPTRFSAHFQQVAGSYRRTLYRSVHVYVMIKDKYIKVLNSPKAVSTTIHKIRKVS